MTNDRKKPSDLSTDELAARRTSIPSEAKEELEEPELVPEDAGEPAFPVKPPDDPEAARLAAALIALSQRFRIRATPRHDTAATNGKDHKNAAAAKTGDGR